MNRKKLPLILMLTAGAITSVMTFMLRYPLKDKLFALFIVLLIFAYIGYMIKNLLDYFDKQNEKRAEEEGEVIKKESDSNEDGKEQNAESDSDSKDDKVTEKDSKEKDKVAEKGSDSE